MNAPAPSAGARLGVRLEWMMALAVVGFLGWDVVQLIQTGGQPQPFIYHINDVYMDWFNTSYWANNSGAYDVWKSIYPPLSFVFLRVFSIHACYIGESVPARECDWVGKGTLFAFYFLSVWVCWRGFRSQNRSTAAPRTIAMALGLPMLFGLERGNLILVCFPFFAWANGPGVGSARLRWLCKALTINFKPYLLVTLGPDLAHRRWLAIEAVLLMTGLIYALTWAAFGAGTPAEVIDNIITFTTISPTNSWQDVYYATSYNSMIKLLDVNPLVLKLMGSPLVEGGLLVFPLMLYAGQAVIVLTLFLAWLRPAIAPYFRIALLSTALAVTTSESGGYSQILLLYFVFLEPWRGPARIVAIVAAYVLCLPTDYVFGTALTVYQQSYFMSGYSTQNYGVAVGHFLRPGLLLLLVYMLGGLSIANYLRWARPWRRGSSRLVPATA